MSDFYFSRNVSSKVWTKLGADPVKVAPEKFLPGSIGGSVCDFAAWAVRALGDTARSFSSA
jgi:hypothetical protein